MRFLSVGLPKICFLKIYKPESIKCKLYWDCVKSILL